VVVEVALYKVFPGKEPQALAALNDEAALKRRQAGCLDARVLAASRAVASPSTDPQLILTLAEFEDAATFAAYREALAEEEKTAPKPPLAGLVAGPPTYGVFE